MQAAVSRLLKLGDGIELFHFANVAVPLAAAPLPHFILSVSPSIRAELAKVELTRISGPYMGEIVR